MAIQCDGLEETGIEASSRCDTQDVHRVTSIRAYNNRHNSHVHKDNTNNVPRIVKKYVLITDNGQKCSVTTTGLASSVVIIRLS